MRLLVATILVMMSTISSFAQTPKKAAPNKTILEQSLIQAKNDLKQLDALLVKEGLSSKYDVCKVSKLLSFRENAQWFITHYDEFLGFEKNINSQIKLSKEALEYIQKEASKEINASFYNINLKEKVTLKKIIQFLNLLNIASLADIPKIQKQSQQQFGTDFSSLIAVVKHWCSSVNVKLKAQRYPVTVAFFDGDYIWSLEMLVKTDEGSELKSYGLNDARFSLMQRLEPQELELSEYERWQFLSIEHSSKAMMDGFHRYLKLATEMNFSCPLFDRLNYVYLNYRFIKPYVGFSEITAELKSMKFEHDQAVKQMAIEAKAAYARAHKKITRLFVESLTTQQVEKDLLHKEMNVSYAYEYKRCVLVNQRVDFNIDDIEFLKNSVPVASGTTRYGWVDLDRVVNVFKTAVFNGECE